MKEIGGYTIIGPLCYQGKVGCEHPMCRHLVVGWEYGKPIFDSRCHGYHCSYCDEPCSSQGHRCDAANAILGAAEEIAREERENDAA